MPEVSNAGIFSGMGFDTMELDSLNTFLSVSLVWFYLHLESREHLVNVCAFQSMIQFVLDLSWVLSKYPEPGAMLGIMLDNDH